MHPSCNWNTLILVVNNSVVFIHVNKYNTCIHLLVYNLITKECIELPQPLIQFYKYYAYHIACDFFNMICYLAYIRYFLFTNKILMFINHPHIYGKTSIPFSILHQVLSLN